MAEFQNFDNGPVERFNIHLEADGRLHFKADDTGGNGSTRMVIDDDSGEVTIGGDGEFGQLQLKADNGANTIFLGGELQAIALLGGSASGQDGRIKLFDSSGRETVDLQANGGKLDLHGNLFIYDDAGDVVISLLNSSRLHMRNSTGVTTVSLEAAGTAGLVLYNSSGDEVVTLNDFSLLRLGGNGNGGEIEILDSGGDMTINCDGDTGDIECASLNVTGLNLTEESNGHLKTNIAPLMNALDSVLALRGVRYQRKQVTEPTAAAASEAQQIGLIGQEVEAVCPELVATDAKGRKSVSYSRMTVVLVEAIKEQQQLIRDQAAALDEALGKISTIEAGLASHD